MSDVSDEDIATELALNKDALDALRTRVRAGFKREIDALTGKAPKMSTKSAADIMSGWDDGWRCAVVELIGAGWRPTDDGDGQ